MNPPPNADSMMKARRIAENLVIAHLDHSDIGAMATQEALTDLGLETSSESADWEVSYYLLRLLSDVAVNLAAGEHVDSRTRVEELDFAAARIREAFQREGGDLDDPFS